jgi:hypothetical protein
VFTGRYTRGVTRCQLPSFTCRLSYYDSSLIACRSVHILRDCARKYSMFDSPDSHSPQDKYSPSRRRRLPMRRESHADIPGQRRGKCTWRAGSDTPVVVLGTPLLTTWLIGLELAYRRPGHCAVAHTSPRLAALHRGLGKSRGCQTLLRIPARSPEPTYGRGALGCNTDLPRHESIGSFRSHQDVCLAVMLNLMSYSITTAPYSDRVTWQTRQTPRST